MSLDLDDRVTHTAGVGPVPGRPQPPELPERFVLLRPLGRGGQGEVWLAEDRVLGQRVALKLIRDGGGNDGRERTLQEARVGREVSHPNLIRVFDVLDLPGLLVVVMEWVEGGSLKERLREGPLPADQVVRAAEQTLDVLAHLHGKGIVHRDVKPSNLLFDRDGQVRLADLGLVRHLERSADLTRTGVTVGTPDYMSPEQLRGEAPSPAADLYALGVTLFELLTGARPFAGSSDFAVAHQHLTEPPPDLRRGRPDCPRWLAAFVRRLLEKRPADRWPDAAAAREALRRRWAPRRRWWRWVAVGAAAVAVVAGCAWIAASRLRPAVAEVAVDGDDVVALAVDGTELWRRVFPGGPTVPLLADVVGSSVPEVVTCEGVVDPSSGRSRCELVVLSQRGSELARTFLETDMIRTHYPHLTDDLICGKLFAGDLDGDRRPEVLWSVSHPWWFPAAAGVWWGRRGGASQVLLVNSGRIYGLDAADVDGDGEPELVASGVNNPIGYQAFLAVVEPSGGGYSPDIVTWLIENPPVRLYLPLGPQREQAWIESAGADGFDVRLGAQLLHLTRDGSEPGESPVEWDARRGFWDRLVEVCRQAEFDPGGAEGRFGALEADQRAVLSEPGSRLAASLLAARSLARGGDQGAAIRTLRRAAGRDPDFTDLWLRLGEQRLIAGERRAGREALVRSLTARTSGRNPFDAPLMLHLDAALHGDGAARDQARGATQAYAARGQQGVSVETGPLWPFFRGDWADPALDPAPPARLVKAGDVLRLWARLERGGDPAEVARAAEAMEDNPEVADQARMLRTVALGRLGEAGQAVKLAGLSLERLEERGRESYEAFAWVPLAEWALGNALEAAGKPEAARPHLERATALGPNTWFGSQERRDSEPGTSKRPK